MSGIEIKNKALAGVGKPIKPSIWRVSILNLAEEIGVIRKGKVTIENLPFQQDIANMSGTSRETVSRILKLFEDRQLILKEGHRVLIPDYLFFKKSFG